MLRVLENCDYTQVIEMLLDIVMKYRNSLEKSKISGLGIKCLLKIHQILQQIISNIKIDKILLKLHLILCEFEKKNFGLESDDQTDQMIIRFIKNFIYELVKIKKEEIAGEYRLVEKHSIKDNYIKKWIRSILNTIDKDSKEINIANSSLTSNIGNNKNLNLNEGQIENNQIIDDNKIRNSEIKKSSPKKSQMININTNKNYDNNSNRNERESTVFLIFLNFQIENKVIKVNTVKDNINNKTSGNNLQSLIDYKNKLKELKDKDMVKIKFKYR